MNSLLIKIASLAFCTAVFFSCSSSRETSPVQSNPEATVSEPQEEKQSIYHELKAHIHLPVQEVIALYFELKKASPNKYNFENEQELNRFGYDLLQEDKTASAIEIFKVLVSEFPLSANSYDSLGEAYLKTGDEVLALKNYEKSIQLNPKNHHAIDQVTILKGLEILVTDWGKEFFHFPLHFAEEIPYQGVEEVVFPKNWIKPDSSDFWSYVFVWALEEKQVVTATELESNLTLYFDGLIGGLSRVDTSKLTDASVRFEKNNDPQDSVLFTGKLNIFDGFATQEPLTLNARVYSDYCEERDQLILLFRFSPQAYDHPVWDLLRTVKVRSSICQE